MEIRRNSSTIKRIAKLFWKQGKFVDDWPCKPSGVGDIQAAILEEVDAMEHRIRAGEVVGLTYLATGGYWVLAVPEGGGYWAIEVLLDVSVLRKGSRGCKKGAQA